MILTPPQRGLARHALGLPNQRRRSYRNRFFAVKGHSARADWMAMTEAGLAVHHPDGDSDLFKLTEAGARAALNSMESLDPEDFPAVGEKA